MNTSNPLLRKSKLQFQAPEFDKIKNEHFKPAFDLGLKEHNDEILAIANNPAKPTFENTILALEKSGELLKRARLIFGNLTSANTNPSLQALDQEYSAIFAGHNDKIYLNEKLYKRVKAVMIKILTPRVKDSWLSTFKILNWREQDFQPRKKKNSNKSTKNWQP